MALDNPLVVTNHLARRVFAGVTVLGVLSLVLLPPEHVHPGYDRDERHPDVVHRHLQLHDVVEHLDAQARVDHEDDDDAQYLTAAFIAPKAASRTEPIRAFVIVDWPSAPSLETPRWTRATSDVRVHDPPWRATSGLRGPPTLLV